MYWKWQLNQHNYMNNSYQQQHQHQHQPHHRPSGIAFPHIIKDKLRSLIPKVAVPAQACQSTISASTNNNENSIENKASNGIQHEKHYAENDKIRNNNAIMSQEEQNKSSYNDNKDNNENTATTSTTTMTTATNNNYNTNTATSLKRLLRVSTLKSLLRHS